MTPYLLVDMALIAITFCAVSITILVVESLRQSRRARKDAKEHTCEGPEVVLVPMGGPMGPPIKPPTSH